MKLNIKGTIVSDEDKPIYDYCGISSTCPSDVLEAFEALTDGEHTDIYINSGGGDMVAATEIYTKIREHKDNVTIHVSGMAASAATIIMCAAESEISPTAMVMIHNVSSAAYGNHKDFEHQSDVLKTADKAVCQAYTEKTGKTEDEFLQLMDSEKWFTAKEAVEIGLCDRIAGREILENGYCDFITEDDRENYKKAKLKAQLQLELLNLKKGCA